MAAAIRRQLGLRPAGRLRTSSTAVTGFRGIWDAVLQEFFERSSPGGLRFSINDGGARPDTVTLRLMQSVRLMETEA
jgi:malonate decarboxylase delta subunit